MYSEEFIKKLNEQILDDNLKTYKHIYESTILDEKVKMDTFYKDAITFFRSLPTQQQEILFKIIEQTIVDTASTILGVIDGPVTLDGVRGDFKLTYKAPHGVETTLSGDLQTDFLNSIDAD